MEAKSILLLILSGSFLLNINNLNISANKFDYHQQLKQNPNQFWAMYGKYPVIQKTNHKNEITYYIENVNTNSKYTRAWKYAINQYNKLKVIKLIPTNKKNAQIKLTFSLNNKNSQNSYAETYLNNKHYIGSKNAYFTKSNCILLSSMNNHNLHFYKLVAEHELGHALGFEHNDNKINGQYLIMNSGKHHTFSKNNQPKPLGNYEKMELQMHYNNKINKN